MQLLENNKVGVSYAEITEFVDYETIKKRVTRDKKEKNPHGYGIIQLKRGCLNTPALFDLDTLPTELQKQLVGKHGDPRPKEDPFLKLVHTATDAATIAKISNYYAQEFTLPDGRHLPKEVQHKYVMNVLVLNAMQKLMTDQTLYIKSKQGNPRKIVWKNAVINVNDVRQATGHDLPATERGLRNILKRYKEKGLEGMISGNFLNNNRCKIKDIEQEALLRKLLGNYRNFDDEQIRQLYNTLAEPVGWPVINAKTVANYRHRWGLQIHGGRFGETDFDNVKAMLVKRKRATYPLYFWSMDGWVAELLYQETIIDKDGYSRTTYHNRPTVVVVLDACGRYPVGYAIGKQETPDLIKQALRNALKHTRELFGSMHKPLQLQTDRYGKGTLTPFYETVAQKYIPARVKNAKAKPVESEFNRFNHDYVQLYCYNWSGHNVTAKSTNQPNDDYLNKIRHSFPDYQGVCKQLETMIAKWRADKREEYLSLYAQMPQEDKITISEAQYLYTLGEVTGYTNRLQAMGLCPTIAGQKQYYDTFDMQFRQFAYLDWQVRYDPEDLQQILAVNEDGTRRFMLTQKYEQPLALCERQEGDAAELAKIRQYNKQLKGQIMEANAKDDRIVQELLQRPELQDTLTKLVITDSNGQYKDRRNDNRLKSAQKLLAKQNKKMEKVETESFKESVDAYLDSKVDMSKYLSI